MICKNFLCGDNQVHYTERLKNGCLTSNACDSYGYPEKCKVRLMYNRINRMPTQTNAIGVAFQNERAKAIARMP